MNSKRQVSIAWILSAFVVILAIAVWLDAGNKLSNLTAYSVFPLLGLAAFSLIWVHYVMGAKRRYYKLPKSDFEQFLKATSIVVLVLILLHPGLLILQLWRSGFGLPPGSYLEHYVAPSAKWAVMLGSLSFVIFLLFELKGKFGDKTWWKWIDLAQVIALIAVFVHGLRLGGELNIDWYRTVWYFYGLSFIVAVSYTYLIDLKILKEKT